MLICTPDVSDCTDIDEGTSDFSKDFCTINDNICRSMEFLKLCWHVWIDIVACEGHVMRGVSCMSKNFRHVLQIREIVTMLMLNL